MKRFKFKFTTVEKIRKSAETLALRDFGLAQRAYQVETEHKLGLVSDLSRAIDRRETLGLDPAPPSVFAVEDSYVTGTRQRIRQAENAVFRAGKQVEKAGRAYIASMRKRKMITHLHDVAKGEYRDAARKNEARRMDDLYIMRQGGPNEISDSSDGETGEQGE